nr:MAG TPA: hypothetical protein [Caudoviricetes sp.]
MIPLLNVPINLPFSCDYLHNVALISTWYVSLL